MRQPCNYRSAEISHDIVNERIHSNTTYKANTLYIRRTMHSRDNYRVTAPERPRQMPPRDHIVQHTSISSVSQRSQQRDAAALFDVYSAHSLLLPSPPPMTTSQRARPATQCRSHARVPAARVVGSVKRGIQIVNERIHSNTTYKADTLYI